MSCSRRIVPTLFALLAAVSGSAGELWVPPTHSVVPTIPPALNGLWPVTSSGLAVFGFAVPDDFDSLVAARVVVIPRASSGGTYSVYAEVKRNGEPVAIADAAAFADLPLLLTANQVTEIDVGAIFASSLDGGSAGADYVTLAVYAPSLLTQMQVLGLRFVYDAALVDTNDIADAAITSAKLGDGAVTSVHIRNETIASVDILDNSVTTADIKDGTLDGADIADNSITANDLGPGSVGASELANDSVLAQHIAADAVGASEIAANAVGASEIAANSVGASELIAGTEFKNAHLDSGIAVVLRGSSGPNINRFTTADRALNTNQATTFQMSCPTGWFATGAGFWHERQNSTGVRIGPSKSVHSYLSYPTSQQSWDVGVVSQDGTYLIITRGYIVCVEMQ